ncbi:MAG: PqqD family protein [Cyanobacteria bacterium P01_A01_bin.123]
MPSQSSEISSNAVILLTQDQISCELSGEAVILNMVSGIYYGLNEVGAYIWELIQQPRSFGALCSILVEEYDVPAEVCKQELTNILLELKNANLIEVRDEPIQ